MLDYKIVEHELEFINPATTSRNVFTSRKIYIVELSDGFNRGKGEAAPLSLLSIDDLPNYKEILQAQCELLSNGHELQELDLTAYPSIEFGLETALLSLEANGAALYKTPFTKGEDYLSINGLVWMADTKKMLENALKLAETGFKCIKLKLGAQDFDEECKMLEKIRSMYSAFKLEIRVDANGAFKADEAKEQMRELRRFDLHSIEQPIATKQWDAMAELCREKIIPIALDEELIGITPSSQSLNLLNYIKPQYIILKPNLIGGFTKSDLWIKSANSLDISWWATSALESNIGLSAIAQWVSSHSPNLPQGLGTGSLYQSNFKAQHELIVDKLWFKQ